MRDMTATFAADVLLDAAQARLAAENQWLPIDGDPSAQLGRLVETNSTGPLRLGYGAWRDLLLGCQFTIGSGELITAGGRTVKNVAGYDLTKFMVGQYGIYGSLLTITVRTYRRPTAALLATFKPEPRRLNAMLTTPARPQWSILSSGSMICGYLGDAATVDFLESELPRHEPDSVKRWSPEEDIAARAKLWSKGSFRASVPPASIMRFVEQSHVSSWNADPAFGIVIGTCAAAERPRITRAAGTSGGSVTFFDDNDVPLNLPGAAPVRALLERLKHSFDPEGKLAPLPLIIA